MLYAPCRQLFRHCYKCASFPMKKRKSRQYWTKPYFPRRRIAAGRRRTGGGYFPPSSFPQFPVNASRASAGRRGAIFQRRRRAGASLVRTPLDFRRFFFEKSTSAEKWERRRGASRRRRERENIGSGRWREDLKGFRQGREGKICQKSTLPPAHILPMLYSPSSNRFFGERHENQGLKYICTHASSASSTGFL